MKSSKNNHNFFLTKDIYLKMNVCKLYNATIANLEYKNNPYYTFDTETKTYSGNVAYLTLDFYLMKKRKE